MMSLGAIRSASDEAAQIAASECKEPYVLFDSAEVDRLPGGRLWNGRKPFPFPRIGSYVPDGWTEVDSLFVDSSGVGGPGEPALTLTQLNAKLYEIVADERTLGLAITDVGQFQLFLGVFEKV